MEGLEEITKTASDHKVALVVIAGVGIGLFLYWQNSQTSSAASGGVSANTAAGLNAYTQSYQASLAAQAAAGQSQAQLQAVQSQSQAYLGAAQAKYNSQTAVAALGANAANIGNVLGAYTATQQAAFNYATTRQELNAALVTNLYTVSQQAQTAQQANNLSAEAYVIGSGNQLLMNQNNNQAYLYSNQGASLSQQAIQGNNALAQANIAGAANSAGGSAAPIQTSFSYGPFKGTGNF